MIYIYMYHPRKRKKGGRPTAPMGKNPSLNPSDFAALLDPFRPHVWSLNMFKGN
jgi:hypothetical protein